jgi:Trk-type K+ transport system membrane component
MSIEQTTQLIQLILNAVLMLGACGVVLCASVMYQVMLEKRSRSAEVEVRSVRHRIHRQQRQVRRSVFWLSGACWWLGLSCGLLVLRSVWNWNALIPLSLGLFVIACGLFLIGAGALFFTVMTSTTAEPMKKPNLAKVVEFRGRSMRRRS